MAELALVEAMSLPVRESLTTTPTVPPDIAGLEVREVISDCTCEVSGIGALVFNAVTLEAAGAMPDAVGNARGEISTLAAVTNPGTTSRASNSV